MTQSIRNIASFVVALSLILSAVGFGALEAHATAEIGDLVKCGDSTSVYYVAEDGERHPFPNENIYFSWYVDFAEVEDITCEELAEIPLGASVTYQGGTRLVKLPSVPVVYFPQSGGVLRPIQSEEQAQELFGDDWASLVDDLSEAFYPHYTLGTDLPEGELPDDMLLTDDDGSLFRVEAGDAVEIDSLVTDLDRSVLDDFAFDLSEVEDRLEREIARLVDEIVRDLLDEIWDLIEDELDEVYFTDDDPEDELLEEMEDDSHEDDLDDETESQIEDTLSALEDAEEELVKAEIQIDDREEGGQDVTEARDLLSQAYEAYNSAIDALELGNYEESELLAEDARDLANEAREGEHADSVDDTPDDSSDDTTDDTTDDSSDDSAEPERVEVDLTSGNFFFSPDSITVESGAEVRINFASNEGTHTFAIDELGLDETIEEGEDLRFMADLEPGTYTFYCSVGDHQALGMEGTLIVE